MRLPTVEVGDVFERLSVLFLFMRDVGVRTKRKKKYTRRERYAVVRCSCGSEFELPVCNLKTGNTKSCGCLRSDRAEAFGTEHPLYSAWRAMRQRCRNPNSDSYADYGARGIRVCDGWHDCKTFIQWAEQNGYSPGLTIERIDNNGNYEPGNCRFASRQEQNLNTRRNLLITAFGETKCCAEWAADPRCAVTASTLRWRIRAGRPSEEAITIPSRRAK